MIIQVTLLLSFMIDSLEKNVSSGGAAGPFAPLVRRLCVIQHISTQYLTDYCSPVRTIGSSDFLLYDMKKLHSFVHSGQMFNKAVEDVRTQVEDDKKEMEEN